MKQVKVLITGGAGFIGYHLANYLLKIKYKVDIVDNFSRAINDSFLIALGEHEDVNIIDINILDDDLKTLANDYDYVYHFAAIIGVQHVINSPKYVLENNFLLLQKILEFCFLQKDLKKICFTSTSEVYAGTLKEFGLEFPTSEKTPLTISDLSHARTSYMLSKIYGEAMCVHSKLPVTIVRPHNFYGPRMGLSHVIPELMKRIRDSNKSGIDIHSINHKRTFCYIEDAIKMIRSITENKNSIGNIYNIGNYKEEISVGSLTKKIMKIIGKELKINSLVSNNNSPERRIPSMKKFSELVTFEPSYSLNDGLQETYNWYNNYIFNNHQDSAI